MRSIVMSTAAMLMVGSLVLQTAATGLQPEPQPAPGTFRLERTVFMETELERLPSAPVTVSAVSLTLAPGARTTPFSNAGPVIVSVREGTVQFRWVPDEANATNGDQRVAPPPIPPSSLQSPGQVTIPAGSMVLLHNAGSEPAWLVVVALTPRPTRTA